MTGLFQFICLVVFNENSNEVEKKKHLLTGFELGNHFLCYKSTVKTGFFSVEWHWTY